MPTGVKRAADAGGDGRHAPAPLRQRRLDELFAARPTGPASAAPPPVEKVPARRVPPSVTFAVSTSSRRCASHDTVSCLCDAAEEEDDTCTPCDEPMETDATPSVPPVATGPLPSSTPQWEWTDDKLRRCLWQYLHGDGVCEHTCTTKQMMDMHWAYHLRKRAAMLADPPDPTLPLGPDRFSDAFVGTIYRLRDRPGKWVATATRQWKKVESCTNGRDDCTARKNHASGRCKRCEREFKGERRRGEPCTNGRDGCTARKNHASGRCKGCEREANSKDRRGEPCTNGRDGCKARKNHTSGRCKGCEREANSKDRRGEPCTNGRDDCTARKNHASGRCEVCEREFKGERRRGDPCTNGRDGCTARKNHASGRCKGCEREFTTGRRNVECDVHGCTKVAVGGGMKGRCTRHGGGYRCAVEGAHEVELEERGYAPCAEYKLSSNAQINNYAKPEWEGVRCCLGCLKRLDPTNVAVKIYVHKEHLVMAAAGEEMHIRGKSDFVSRLVHDCATGPSQRRPDLALRVSPRLLVILENDENQHNDRTTSCERRKLAGHFIDHGAPGFTKAEDELWDDRLPTDSQLEAMCGTPADTPEMQRLRRARRAANQRVIRDASVAMRSARAGCSSVEDAARATIAPKLHVIRFNCDAYVAADGTRVGGLFHATNIQSEADVLKLKPNKSFKPTIERLVDELLRLCESEADDAWFDAQPELRVSYLRYDGCDREGRDADGSVAREHAARRVDDGDSTNHAEEEDEDEEEGL